MFIAAYDPATTTGWCCGKVGSMPRSGSVRLKKPAEHRDVAPYNMLCFLNDSWTVERPDLVVVECFMNPAAQKSADAIILQIMVYGMIVGMCRRWEIPYESLQRTTVVKHFIGEHRARDRAALKAAVIQRAILLGYMPRDAKDDNRADAAALWDFGAAYFGRTPPKSLVLFGERPPAEAPA